MTREQGLICKIGIDFENNNVSTFIHAQIAPLIKLPIKQSHSNCNVQMGKWSHKKLLICHSVIWIVTSLPADLDLPYYLWVMLPSCSNAQGYRHKQSNLQIAASGELLHWAGFHFSGTTSSFIWKNIAYFRQMTVQIHAPFKELVRLQKKKIQKLQ